MRIHYSPNKIVPKGFNSGSTELDVLRFIDVSLSELRLLVTAFSSITGAFFAENSDKIALCSFISANVSPLLLLSLKMPTSVYEQELRSIECTHFGSVILRLLGNFRLSVACCMNHGLFEEMLRSLGLGTFQLSEELAILAELQLKKIYRYNNDEKNAINSTELNKFVNEGELDLFEGWRGESLDILLDAWCMILDDPIMIVDNNNQVNGSNNILISQLIKNILHDMAGGAFSLLFECIMRSTVYETLDCINDNEEDDFSSLSNNLLRSICTVGRTNFGISLLYVHRL